MNIWARKKDGRWNPDSVNPEYTHENARRQILDFIRQADFLVAYEPARHDRNRLKSLLGLEDYSAHVEGKAVDFKLSVINSLFTTDVNESTHIYLRAFTQPDVYDNLLQVGSVSLPVPKGFLSIPQAWKADIDMKCRVDVHQLHNLFVYFQSILSQ